MTLLPDSTVLGRMANPLAVTALGWRRTFMIVITLGTQRFRPDVWFPVTIACGVGLACVLPLILLVLIILGKIIILSFPFCLTHSLSEQATDIFFNLVLSLLEINIIEYPDHNKASC
ncbi:hypothetical protein Tco_0308683 [Tanacetum coccineum]